MEIKQYQVFIVNLDPTVGSEIKKTRSCVVISPDEMNRHLNTIVIAPITSQSKRYPTRLEIILNDNINWIAVDQIRTIDKKRIIKNIAELTVPEVRKLKNKIREIYVD